MKVLICRPIVVLMLLSMLLNITIPISRTYAGSPSINVNLPIADIQGLIQQLQDAGRSLVGEAAVQMQAIIQELTSQMQQLVNQIKDAANEVIKEASAQLQILLNDLAAKARSLLNEIKNMAQGLVNCINQDLADRIAQIKDGISSILVQASQVIKESVDRIYYRSSQLIDTGSSRVAIVLNSTVNIIAKAVIVIIALIIFFWMIRALWKGIFPKSNLLKILVPSLVVVLLAVCGYLLISPTAMARILGSSVSLPIWENACDKGTQYYNQFINLKNQNADAKAIQAAGDSALVQLNWCLYACVSPEINRGTQQKIDEIAAVLYPPPTPPPANTTTITPCSGNNPVSINPAWLSAVTLNRITVLNEMKAKNILKATVFSSISNRTVYFDNVKKLTGQDPKEIIMRKFQYKINPVK